MADVKDVNFYPLPFHKFESTAFDLALNPTTTVFRRLISASSVPKVYEDVFTWTMTWNDAGNCTGWELDVLVKV